MTSNIRCCFKNICFRRRIASTINTFTFYCKSILKCKYFFALGYVQKISIKPTCILSSLSRRDAALINILIILDLHTLIYCQGIINQYVMLVSPPSLLSTFSLNVLILLLSVAGILVLIQWRCVRKCQRTKRQRFYDRNSFLWRVIILLFPFINIS